MLQINGDIKISIKKLATNSVTRHHKLLETVNYSGEYLMDCEHDPQD